MESHAMFCIVEIYYVNLQLFYDGELVLLMMSY